MSELLRRHSLFITSIVLLICSFQLMSISVANRDFPRSGGRLMNSILSPAERIYSEFFQTTKYYWQHYAWLIGVEAERDELVARVKELEAHNSRLMELESENQRLRSLLGFTQHTGNRGVVAQVIGRDPSNWVKGITIDRGALDGLRPGLAVVDGNAIVGQTTAVSENSARVLLLTDNSSAIDALVQNSRVSGTAEGWLGRAELKLRYVLKDKEFVVNPGERVISSGLDGVFTKGLLIGVVHNVDTGSSGLFQEITIQPSVDVSRLENVLVLVPEWQKPTQQLEQAKTIDNKEIKVDGE